MSHATLRAAPAEGPTIMPSTMHALRAYSTDSSCDACAHSSTTPGIGVALGSAT